jgi:hypothetical protein
MTLFGEALRLSMVENGYSSRELARAARVSILYVTYRVNHANRGEDVDYLMFVMRRNGPVHKKRQTPRKRKGKKRLGARISIKAREVIKKHGVTISEAVMLSLEIQQRRKT